MGLLTECNGQHHHPRAPHALAIPLPSQGHINPMITLCEQLAGLGFFITFLNTKTVHNKMLKANGKAELGDPVGLRFMSVPDESFPQENFFENLISFLTAAENHFKDEVEGIVKQLMDPDDLTPPLTCIISDPFFGWTQDIASKFSISRICFWTSSATFALIASQLPVLQEKGILPAKQGETKLIDLHPNVPPIPAEFLPQRFQGSTDSKMRMTVSERDDWVLVNSFYELEKHQFDMLQQLVSPRVVSAGPLIPLNGRRHFFETEQLSCIQWLEQQEHRSVLYISFGSLATLSVNDLAELSIGLERSNCSYLWVIRADTHDQPGIGELLDKLKQAGRGLIISWAPQLEVLQHPSVAAFLTHCGWNSLMEATAAGVPVLAWPCFAEQKVNCMFAVEQWRVGFRAFDDSQSPTADVIEKNITRIMGEDGNPPRQNMEQLSAACVGAFIDGGTSFMNLQAFSADMKNKTN